MLYFVLQKILTHVNSFQSLRPTLCRFFPARSLATLRAYRLSFGPKPPGGIQEVHSKIQTYNKTGEVLAKTPGPSCSKAGQRQPANNSLFQPISVDKTNHAIHWIAIYPVNSIIHFSNSRALEDNYFNKLLNFPS